MKALQCKVVIKFPSARESLEMGLLNEVYSNIPEGTDTLNILRNLSKIRPNRFYQRYVN